MDQITSIVLKHFKGVSEYDIKKQCRKREFVLPRQCAMYFNKKYSMGSLKEIGRHFNRDHTTVIHARKAINDLRDTDKVFREIYQKIDNEIELSVFHGFDPKNVKKVENCDFWGFM